MLWWLTAQGRQKYRRKRLYDTSQRPPLVIEHYPTDRGYQRGVVAMAELGYAARSQGYSGKPWPDGGWVVTYGYVGEPRHGKVRSLR